MSWWPPKVLVFLVRSWPSGHRGCAANEKAPSGLGHALPSNMGSRLSQGNQWTRGEDSGYGTDILQGLTGQPWSCFCLNGIQRLIPMEKGLVGFADLTGSALFVFP
ncbi:hypothetical protein LY76DRAFT_588142 [Colletotrichum caudatum]|nr:hypothetical protein LY76DRAFT_588142 [Colletotrichum caudatum]